VRPARDLAGFFAYAKIIGGRHYAAQSKSQAAAPHKVERGPHWGRAVVNQWPVAHPRPPVDGCAVHTARVWAAPARQPGFRTRPPAPREQRPTGLTRRDAACLGEKKLPTTPWQTGFLIA
jgi:hypothetical protein